MTVVSYKAIQLLWLSLDFILNQRLNNYNQFFTCLYNYNDTNSIIRLEKRLAAVEIAPKGVGMVAGNFISKTKQRNSVAFRTDNIGIHFSFNSRYYLMNGKMVAA